MADQWLADIDTPKGQGKLNGHLGKQSYISGHTPSQDDVRVFTAVKEAPNKFPHLKRWYNHVASFTQDEREHFGVEDYVEPPKVEPPKTEAPKQEKTGGDDDFDFFSDTPVDDSALKEKQAELQAQKEKDDKEKNKGKKKIIERSNIVFNVKPAEADTNMEAIEEFVRGIQMEGLDWKASELVDLAFGVKTLKISCNIIDELVSVDDIEETMSANEELISSVEILTFTKL